MKRLLLSMVNSILVFTKQSKEQKMYEYLNEIHLPKIYILPKEKEKEK